MCATSTTKDVEDKTMQMIREAKGQRRRSTKMTIPENRTWQDKWNMILLLCLLPYMLAAYLGIALFLLFLRAPSFLYGLKAATLTPRAYVRETFGFYATMSFESLLLFPLVVFAVVHIIFVHIVAFVWCAPLGILTGVNPIANFKLVWKCTHYRKEAGCGWPLVPGRTFQFWRCVLGLYHRQHLWEWFFAPGWMIVFNPVLKYVACCNIWIYNLEEKYCNQWTDAFPLEQTKVKDLIKGIVSHWKVEEHLRDDVDQACFCGHYASPPPSTPRTAEGMQVLGMQFAPRKLSTNLTMTTHVHRIDPVPKARSATASDPLWCVELHYWNPWHFLTGYVEVSMHRDPDDANAVALEHPMWIIVPKNGKIGNKLYLGVNKLFSDYSPELHATILKAAARMKDETILEASVKINVAE